VIAVQASTSISRAAGEEKPFEVVTTLSVLADSTRDVGGQRVGCLTAKPAASQHAAPKKHG
jgi:hypothetical protein